MSHTKGPWTVEPHTDKEYGDKELCSFAIMGPKLDEDFPGLQIATIVSDCVSEHESNARLISCSTELLEALELIHANCDLPDEYGLMIEEIIAKARGQ